MAVSNTDDHLRNHGFLLTNRGWRLSPVYDVNPVPDGETLSLNVSLDDARIDPELAVEVAPFFGINQKDARNIANQMLSTVRRLWRPFAEECGLGRREQKAMEPAFQISEGAGL